MDWLNELSQTLSQPAMKHAMIVHWPIVLGGIGMLLALLVAITGGKHRTLQWLALLAFVALTVAGFMAMNSGEDAELAIEGSLSAEASAALERHEQLADWVWIFGAGLVVLTSMTFLKPRGAKRAAAWIAVLGSAFVMSWIANVAHFGGTLVYEFGVGAGRVEAARPQRGASEQSGANEHPVADPSTAAEPDDPRDIAQFAALSPKESFFVAEVRPLLESYCWKCHNPQRRKGGFDQTSQEAMLRGGRSGPSISVGKPEESLLIAALKYENEELQMPPKDRLSNEQIAVFERWIADGAAWVDIRGDTASPPPSQ